MPRGPHISARVSACAAAIAAAVLLSACGASTEIVKTTGGSGNGQFDPQLVETTPTTTTTTTTTTPTTTTTATKPARLKRHTVKKAKAKVKAKAKPKPKPTPTPQPKPQGSSGSGGSGGGGGGGTHTVTITTTVTTTTPAATPPHPRRHHHVTHRTHHTAPVAPAPPRPAWAPPRSSEAALHLATFGTADGSIGCELGHGIARCDIATRTWRPPAKPSRCALAWGGGLTVGPLGPARFTCASDSAFDPSAQTVRAGLDDYVGSVLCEVRASGVTCYDRGGYGFFIGRTGYQRFTRSSR